MRGRATEREREKRVRVRKRKSERERSPFRSGSLHFQCQFPCLKFLRERECARERDRERESHRRTSPGVCVLVRCDDGISAVVEHGKGNA